MECIKKINVELSGEMLFEYITAIQGISGYGAYIPTVSARDNITAYCLNQIVSELNAIP